MVNNGSLDAQRAQVKGVYRSMAPQFKTPRESVIRPSDFGLLSVFGFRPSDLGLQPALACPWEAAGGGRESMDYTSQISTPCFKEARASLRLGMNSWAQNPLKPVSMIAFITAG